MCLAILAGCGSSRPAPTPEPEPELTAPASTPPGELVDGCYVEEGAPAPLGCTEDSECIGGGIFDPASCCMTGVTHTHSRTYHAWQLEAFRARCDGQCIESPSRPLPCQTVARCVSGRCADTCEPGAPVSDAELDAMERSELELACERGSTAACDRLGH